MADAGSLYSNCSRLKKHLRYLMVCIVFVEFFIATGPTYNYSILFVSLQEEFGASASLTGWVGSIANAIMGCGSPVCAPLIHRFGPRVVTLAGAVVLSIGLAATSFVPDLSYAYLTFGVLVGFGANFIAQSGLKLLFDWFPGKSCSRGTSLALIGTSFGVLTFPPLLNTLIPAYGWRNALRIVSGGSLVIAVALGIFIEAPKEVTSRTSKTSFDVDRGDYSIANGNSDSDKIARNDDRQQDDTMMTIKQKLVKLLLLADTWMWVFGLTMAFLGWTFVIVNYASFMKYDLHFTTDQVSVAFVLFAVGEIIGKTLLAIFGDHLPFSKLYLIAAASVIGGATAGLMIVLRTVPLMYMIAFFMGLFRAPSFALSFAATMDLFGDYGSDVFTVISMLPYGIGVFISAPISGGLYDLTGDYTLSLLFILAAFALSACATFIIPIRRRLRSSGLMCRSTNQQHHPVYLEISRKVVHDRQSMQTSL